MNKKGSLKRRDMLKAMTAVPAAALVPLAPSSAKAAMAEMAKAAPQAAEQAVKPYQRKILDEHEWNTIRILSDLIIPSDDRSGSASQAGVPEFVDDWLDFKRGELLAQIRGGLVWLDLECNRLFSHDFAGCTGAQQKQILDRIAFPKQAAHDDANAVAFFNNLRDLVASGFFSSKMGVEDLPYLGNKMLAEWPGCPAEVNTRIQENEKKNGVDL
jgi:Gluconate 2-dehydrogenase subunit 3